MKYIISCVLLIFGISSAFALDIYGNGAFGNMSFSEAGTESLGSSGDSFEPEYFGKGYFGISEAFENDLQFSVEYRRDPILRNSVYTLIGFNADFAQIVVGPFFGLFNNKDSILNSGLSTKLHLEVPGVVFGSFLADSTIGAGISQEGDYVQEKSAIEAGFYVPNVITTLSISSDSFTEKVSPALTVADKITRYALHADVYKKNVRYTVHVLIGYQNLERSFIYNSYTDTDELAAFIVGFDSTFKVSDSLSLMLGTELPLYAWGVGSLGSPSASDALYEVKTGFSWTLQKLNLDYQE